MTNAPDRTPKPMTFCAINGSAVGRPVLVVMCQLCEGSPASGLIHGVALCPSCTPIVSAKVFEMLLQGPTK